MAQGIAAVQPRIYQRLAIPFDQDLQSHQDATVNNLNSEIHALANKIGKEFSAIAVTYLSASSSALKSLTASNSLTQHEVDQISARYETTMRILNGHIARLVEWRQTMTPYLLAILVDGTPQSKKAWSIIEDGNRVTNTLNSPEHIQRFRDLTPDRKSRIVAFCEYRREAFEGSLQSAQEALGFWISQHEALETRRGFVMERITKWQGTKQEVQAALDKVQRDLPESLHKCLRPEEPNMARGTRLEEETNAIFAGLQTAAAEADQSDAESSAMANVEGVEYGENEEEWDELSLVEEDTSESEEWSDEELNTLKDRLGNPFPVLITIGEKKFEERSLYERQVLKQDCSGEILLNDCGICIETLDDPCLLSTCDHVFCYKCIVQALRLRLGFLGKRSGRA